MDAFKNFAITTVIGAPSPADTGTSLIVNDATVFPVAPFNAVVFPINSNPLNSNAEIVRVTGISTNTLTIVRGPQAADPGGLNRAIQVGDQIMAGVTYKLLNDLAAAPSTALTQTITQTAHGFAVGNLLFRNSGVWTKSNANSVTTADVDGMVTSVIDANTFVLSLPGSIISGVLSGLVDGTDYFLSDVTDGTFQAAEPTTAGHISKPVLKATSTTGGLFKSERGIVIPEGTPLGSQFLDDTTSVTAITLGYFVIPSDLDGLSIVDVELLFSTGPSANAVVVGLLNNAGVNILSTNVSVDAGERTSKTASTPPVISNSNALVVMGDKITVYGVTPDASAADRGARVILRFA